ncbi:hypothetical protein [Amycolatopsis orientalis]|uniref:hypothetical protein n=1 Tax=Amycolatopsis orientalis TaxID=31958 RepID=UPI001319B9E5|nr:hypothetical protein [Amycolatopsis orientalis]
MTETDEAVPPEPTITVAWLAGVVLAGIGAGLALVALTLPWIVADAGRNLHSRGLAVSEIGSQGLMFAVLLVVMAIVAAASLSASRRPTLAVRWFSTFVGPMLPVLAILLGSLPSKAALTAAYGPTSLTLSAKPAQGLILFTFGTALLGFGPMLASWMSGPAVTIRRPSPRPARRRSAAPVPVVLALALVPAVLSFSLPWFTTETNGAPPPALAANWLLVYQIALASVLVLAVGAALTAGRVRWGFRTAALYVCAGVWGVLGGCVLLFWDPLGLADRLDVELGTVQIGGGYLAAVIAVPLLLLALWAAPAPEVSQPALEDAA